VSFISSRCKYVTQDIDLLGRIMRAEALGEGNFGMLLVGNVVINRVVANCDVFRNTRTIREVIYQENAFAGVDAPLFVGQANGKERELALRNIQGYRAEPANRALWYRNPGTGVECAAQWYGNLSGRFKQHCFYNPEYSLGCNL